MSRHKLRDRLDRDKLEKLYVRERMSTRRIGDRFGVGASSVQALLVEYDIPRRMPGTGKS